MSAKDREEGERERKRDASLRDAASAQTLQVPSPSRALCLLLSSTGPAHTEPAQTAVPGWVTWRESQTPAKQFHEQQPCWMCQQKNAFGRSVPVV